MRRVRGFPLLGLLGLHALKFFDPALELFDLDLLALVFPRQPLDDFACVGHLHILSTSCGGFRRAVALAVIALYSIGTNASIPKKCTNISPNYWLRLHWN